MTLVILEIATLVMITIGGDKTDPLSYRQFKLLLLTVAVFSAIGKFKTNTNSKQRRIVGYIPILSRSFLWDFYRFQAGIFL